MKTLKFKKIDAFTKGVSSGNPAGYVLLDEGQALTEQEMQKMASELKGYVNEVGYAQRVGDEFNLRYYSSECEVAFCGHATIATMYDLLKGNEDLTGKKEVFINVNAGRLSVFNHIVEEDAVYIMAPDPGFFECSLSIAQTAEALGAEASEISDVLPIRLIDGGLRTLLVPMNSLSGCMKLYPDQERLKQFCLGNGIDIVHVFTEETHGEVSRYRTRVFAPKFGYLEDPATGSGNASFGYYLVDQGLWDGDMTVEQGPDRENPNFLKLKRYERDGKANILFGGCGTIRIEGEYHLHGNVG